ncbi:YHS domain-containing protein [Haladaptatus sp. NG-SE-30]
MATCIVCGSDLDAESPNETDYQDTEFAPATADYGGETYYFCSSEHEAEFESNPEQYAE